MTAWNWQPRPMNGVWKYGAASLRYPATVAPWLSVMLIFTLIYLMSGELTASKGMLIELPKAELQQGEQTDLVAVVLPMPQVRRPLVFFDDTRYFVDDPRSMASFSEHLNDRLNGGDHHSLLLLADKDIASGVLMRLMATAKKSGVEKVLIAEKRKLEGE